MRNFSEVRLRELAEELGADAVYLERDLVLTEIIRHFATGPYRDVLVLKGGQAMRHIYGSARLSKDVDYVLVMTINEMVTEKIRAMYQRGNPRDVYDLWFVFSHDHIRLDQQVICQLIPEKFRQPFVAGGWNRGRLYDRVHQEAHAWDATLRDLVPEYPSLDDALSLIERSLRFLPR